MLLKLGSTGELVTQWQNFLAGFDQIDIESDGDFGKTTHDATVLFQKMYGLTPDGVVGPKTFEMAKQFKVAIDKEDEDEAKADAVAPIVVDPSNKKDPNWPPAPNMPTGNANTEKLFGKIDFDVVQVVEPGSSVIRFKAVMKGDFAKNLSRIYIPQLVGKSTYGRLSNGIIRFHKKASPQIKSLFAAWEAARLLDRVLTWEGSFVFRLIRGSKTTLSNHSYGTAFDINVKWNGLGMKCPLVGEEGSVRELVPLANEYGFYWGGHYRSRKDGMHFECMKLFTRDELHALNRKNGVVLTDEVLDAVLADQ